MRAKKRHSFLPILLLLGFGIPGSIGIFVAQAKAIADQTGFANQIQVGGTDTPTPTSSQLPVAAASSTATVLPFLGGSALGPSTLYAYIQAPSGPIPTPYVIISAFSTNPRGEAITIARGRG